MKEVIVQIYDNRLEAFDETQKLFLTLEAKIKVVYDLRSDVALKTVKRDAQEGV